MKYLTITLIILATAITACKKESKQKCYWTASNGNTVVSVWHHNKPSSDQVKKAEDSCSCTVSLQQYCFPCGTTVTDPGGFDVECK